MRCEYCHTPLEPEMRFCPRCGHPVPREWSESAQTETDSLTTAESAASIPTAEPTAAAVDADPPKKTGDDFSFDAITEDIEGVSYDEITADIAAIGAEDATDGEDDFRFLAAQLETMDRASEADRDDAVSPQLTPRPQTIPTPPFVRSAVPPENIPPAEPYRQTQVFRRPQAPAAPDLREQLEAGDDFDDGYMTAPEEPRGKYRRTTTGKRLGSILLCLLTAVLLFGIVANVSVRMAMTDDAIRDAADSEKLVSQKLIGSAGEESAVRFVRVLIGEDEAEAYGVTDDMITAALRKGTLSRVFSEILTGYTDYFLNNKDSEVLNSDYLTAELDRFNSDLSQAVGMDGDYDWIRKDRIAERINGGDLSMLSIDENGGAFYQRYGVNPKVIATACSPVVLIILGAIVLLCLLMIFVINSSNLPAGMSFSGVTMLIVGGLCLALSLGGLVVSFIKNIWLLTELLRRLAIWMGIFGAALLLIGLVMIIISGSLKKRAKRLDALTDAERFE